MKLNVRYQCMQSTCPDDNVEANIAVVKAALDLDPAETALILVDVWGGHHLKSHYERTGRIMSERIRPCIEAARACGIPVVYAPSPQVARAYPQWVRYAGSRRSIPPKTPPTTAGPRPITDAAKANTRPCAAPTMRG